LTEQVLETAGALLCGISAPSSGVRLLVRQILSVAEAEYLERLPYHLEISPSFYNNLIDACLRAKLSPVIVHTHPSARKAVYSQSDDYGESRLLPVLQTLVPKSRPASLLLTPSSSIGRTLSSKRFAYLQDVTIVGQKVETNPAPYGPTEKKSVAPQFDRQRRAFGEQGQHTIEALKVGIIGLGGTGSVVAEQLARSGVKDFILVDPDKLEESNVSRVFGSTLRNKGLAKVRVVRKHLLSLGAEKVQAIPDSAIRQDILLGLRDRAILFGCVDNDLSRAILARFAHQYLIPLVDIGIRLDGRSGDVSAAAGRVSIVGSGMVCLTCSNHVSAERIRAESLPTEERRGLEREGYIMGIDEPAPAVVSLNTVVAGMGVTAALNLFVNLTGAPQPLDQLYDATAGIVFTARAVHQDGCDVCGSEVGVKGLGDSQIVSAYE
jgi:molybdopterin/thiamine biosynthesis adenylyltransferase